MSSEETKLQSDPSTRQRVRIVFARGENVRYVGHLDMVRTWERIIRRAGLPIAYSEGFNPRPRLTFASALQVGCTSDDEMLDVILAHRLDLSEIQQMLDRAMPEGLRVVDVSEVAYSAPALQTQITASEFFVAIDLPLEELRTRVQGLLDAPRIERRRRDKTYDLRALIYDMWVEGAGGAAVGIGMKLAAGEAGTGRPDEVVSALELNITEVRIHRRRLFFDS